MNRIGLPGTKLQASSICLGTANLGSSVDKQTSFWLMDAYADRGGNFLDTANIYAAWVPGFKGSSERTIGEWMRERRNRAEIVLATKGAHPNLDSITTPRMTRAEVTADLDQSLTDLKTDYIDLYWLHRDDPATPADDLLSLLEEKVKEGKIRYYACSNWTASRIREAADAAKRRGIQGFVANQMMWSLAEANSGSIADPTLVAMDRAAMDYHRATGLAAIPYTSQAQGFFTKLAAVGADGLQDGIRKTYLNEANLDRFAKLKELSRELSVSITALALSYIRSQPEFPGIPIVGCRTVEQLRDSLNDSELVLSPDTVKWLAGDAG